MLLQALDEESAIFRQSLDFDTSKNVQLTWLRNSNSDEILIVTVKGGLQIFNFSNKTKSFVKVEGISALGIVDSSVREHHILIGVDKSIVVKDANDGSTIATIDVEVNCTNAYGKKVFCSIIFPL